MAGESVKVMKNITRVKDAKKRVDGFYVRIQWKKEQYSKLFSVAEYGGEEAALSRAEEWRNDIEESIGKPRTERQVLGVTHPTNTGFKGIRRTMVRHYKRGKRVGKYHAWLIITTLDKDHHQRRTGVSIDKHGEEKALEIARKLYQQRNIY